MTDTTALLYDVHGNLPALEAVLANARARGARRFLLGGDYALFGAWPAETIARLRELGPAATWIRGNVDRWCATPSDAPENPVVRGAIEACRGAVGEEAVNALAGLPYDVVLGDARFCHASPVSDVRSFGPEAQQEDDELLGGAEERLLVFGHTHIQFRRQGPRGLELLNPGSVGLPWDGDYRSAYAVMHDDGSIEHRRVAYDHEASAQAVLERFGSGEWTETVARRIRTASF